MVTRKDSRSASAEQRLKELGIKLPAPPEPFGTYAEAVQTGNLLFLTGMLPTEGRGAKFVGRVGAELDVEAGRAAAHLAALNVLAVARQHLGSLDKVTRIVRRVLIAKTDGSGFQLWRTRVVRCAQPGAGSDQGSDRRDSLPHIQTLRNEPVGVYGRRRCPSIR